MVLGKQKYEFVGLLWVICSFVAVIILVGLQKSQTQSAVFSA